MSLSFGFIFELILDDDEDNIYWVFFLVFFFFSFVMKFINFVGLCYEDDEFFWG